MSISDFILYFPFLSLSSSLHLWWGEKTIPFHFESDDDGEHEIRLTIHK